MNSDWASKDFYAILGVDKKADQAAIKKAYRKLARDNHPDSKPGDKAAEERFKDISEAYSVLSNDKKRKEYDEQRTLFGQFKNGFGAGGYGQPGAGGPQFDFDLSDLLGGVFGGGGRRRSRAPQPRRGADLESQATIGFEQAIEGVTIPLRMTSESPCGTCNGTGAEPGTVPVVCPRCQGSGMMTAATGGVFAMTEPCDECRGRGLIVEHPCHTCRGSGRAPSTRTLQVRVPAGVKDGQRIRLKGKGGTGENGGPDGDLLLLVHVEPHRIFGRKDNHLTVTVPITFDEAVLGANIKVPTLDGSRVTIKVPPGTPSGRTFRARGKGVPLKSGGHGDLLVTVEVEIPAAPDDATRKAAEAMRDARGNRDPRATMSEEVS